MKRAGLRIMLVFIIALTLVIGSVSAVSAARPVRASVTVTNVITGGIYFDFQWDKLNVDYGYFYVYKNTAMPNPIYSSGNY